MTNSELINYAINAMSVAYAPYSKFKVGAALLADNGKIYTGCNIENVAFSPTNCAERTAFFKAISEGERNFSKIAIVGGKDGAITDFVIPCGVCRQVMREFCDDDFIVIVAKSENEYKEYKLIELFPDGFSPNVLEV